MVIQSVIKDRFALKRSGYTNKAIEDLNQILDLVSDQYKEEGADDGINQSR